MPKTTGAGASKKADLTSSMAKSLKDLNILYGRYTEKAAPKEEPESVEYAKESETLKVESSDPS